MDRIAAPPEDQEEKPEEVAAFEAIAARAKPNAAILNDPETQRRIAAIEAGRKPY